MREWEIEREEKTYRLSVSSLPPEAGGASLTLLLVQDVTSRKVTEAEYLHAAKMATVGRMAAGVAHEIGNPIASLSTRLDLIERRNDEQFTRDSIGVIRQQIRRIGGIVRSLADRSRAPRAEWSPCDLGVLLDDAVDMVRLDPAAKKVRFEITPGGPIPPTWCVKDQVTQVLLNLLLNAVEAMPDGGQVSIATRVERNAAVVEVRDSGPGIPPELLERIGTPFFTTKPGGSGLGLSICRQLVEAHGGDIRFANHPAGGAQVTISLPVRSGPEEAGIVEWEG